MHLTGHELTLAASIVPSAVAIVAIVATQRGARTSAASAVMLAREERDSRRSHELVDSRRAAFVEYQSALNQLAIAAQRTQFTAGGGVMGMKSVDEEVSSRNDDLRQAQVLAQNALAAVELLVDPELAGRARAVYTASEQRVRYSTEVYGTIRGGFLAALLEDLRAHDLPGSPDQARLE